MGNNLLKRKLPLTCVMASFSFLSAVSISGGVVQAQALPQEAAPQVRTPLAGDQAVTVAPPSQPLLRAPFMAYSVRSTTTSLPAVGATFQPDQQFVSLAISPTVTIVTKADSLRRPRTFPESLPAQTPMFQVNVDNGVAYCAFWGARQGIRETQCFRDINNDGTFDASYSTYRSIVGTSLYIGRIAGLAPMRPISYETKVNDMPADTISVRFLRITDGVAEFKPQFGSNRRGFAVLKCDLRDREGCNLAGYKFVFEQTGTALTVSSITAGTGEFLLSSERPS